MKIKVTGNSYPQEEEKRLYLKLAKLVKSAGGGEKEFKKLVWVGVKALKKTVRGL